MLLLVLKMDMLETFTPGELLDSNNNLQFVGLNSLVLLLSHYQLDKNCQKWLKMGIK